MDIIDLIKNIVKELPEEDMKSSKSRERFKKNIKRLSNALKSEKYERASEITHSLLRNINDIRRITKGKTERSNISSVVEYPDRGTFGESKFRGNTSGYLLVDLFENVIFKPEYVLDPAEGSRTTRDVCKYMGIKYLGLDLMRGFNLLTDPFPDSDFDFIFFHPPYHNIIRYWQLYYPEEEQDEIRKSDLSGFRRYDDFIKALRKCIDRLMTVLKKGGFLALLIGDIRKSGKYKSIYKDLNTEGLTIKYFIVKKQNRMKSEGYAYHGHPFIPIAHEFVVIFQK
jgi:hypothetical protein